MEGSNFSESIYFSGNINQLQLPSVSHKVLSKLLNDSNKSFMDKVEGLLSGWKSVYLIIFKKPAQPYKDAMDYMHKSTLQYLLHGDWTQLEASLRAKFTVILHKVLMAISKTDQETFKRCKLLIKLIYEPWNNPTLHKILHSQSPTEKEVLDYISTEGIEVLLMRLEVLCEGKCEDLALKLAATLLKYLRVNHEFKKSDIDNISDIVLLLLFRFKRNQEIIEKLKNMDLLEGLELVKRFAHRNTNTTGLWRFGEKVTEIAAHTVLASGMVQNIESKDKQNILFDLVNEWALIHIPKLNKNISTLCNMVRKIVQKAESPIHVYIFAQVLHKELGDQIKPLCIELYIRGFTSNINLIEHYKSSNDYEKTLNAEVLLSNSFLALSELLKENIIIHRECILTAFSLHPTEECMKRLENAALLCCSNCKNHQEILKADDSFNEKDNCDNICCVHAREKTEEQFIEAVNSLNILNSDLLGLAPHLCDDLSTVLCSPRCQTLSWSLGWSRLKSQCEKYLTDHSDHKPRCTELKYLNIDYSQFEKQSSNKSVRSNRKNTKKKTCKPLNVHTNMDEKEVVNKSVTINNKSGVDKNVLSYSMMKINDIWLQGYKVCNDINDCTDVSPIGGYQKLCSNISSDEPIRLVKRTYSSKSKRIFENKLKDISYYHSNEDSVFTCSSNNAFNEIPIHSPKPGEIPPVSLTGANSHQRLSPLIKTVGVCNERVVLTDVISNSVDCRNTFRHGTELAEDIEKSNLPTSSSLKSDKILAKYIPGMNSLDLIVPFRSEPTVQVVQIPSPSPMLQPVVSNSSATQNINTSVSITKPLNESVGSQTECVTTHTQTQPTDTNYDSINNSNILLNTTASQGTSTRAHLSDQCQPSFPNNNICNNKNQNKTNESLVTSETVTTSSEPTYALASTSFHEGITQVTAHIQRVAHPNKQKIVFDESLKQTSNQNSNFGSSSSGAIQQMFEDSSKQSPSSSIPNNIFKFILKDGKVVEQYCHNQNSPYSLPDVIHESHIHAATQHEPVIKQYRRKRDNNNSDNAQAASLPQFHQAFRRQVYQSGSIIDGTSIAGSSPQHFSEDKTDNLKKAPPSIALSKAVQTGLKEEEENKCTGKRNEDSASEDSFPSSGHVAKEEIKDLTSSAGVIFTCKVPIPLPGSTVLQAHPVTIMKTNSEENSSGRSMKTESELTNKDSVIRGNMTALLAAALQSSPVKNNTETTNFLSSSKSNKATSSQDLKIENPGIGVTKNKPCGQKNVRRQTTTLPSNTSNRYSRPTLNTSVNTITHTSPPVVTIPLSSRTVQVLASNMSQNSLANVHKVENGREQLTQNSEQSSVSSTTLEQLREFESVLEQVTNTSQMKERGNTNVTETHITTRSPNTDYPNPVSSKLNTLLQNSLVNAVSDINSENTVSLTFISKASTTCTNTIISGSSPKITGATPVVVVQSCSRPLASPALSVASQNSPSSSPTTSPASCQQKVNPKLPKPKAKSIGKTAPTTTLKVSTIPKPQQKPQEDEQTTQRIYAILDKYAEQLRNSPELKNKPAPRRRSNPPTNPSQSSKRKKSSHSKAKSFSSIPSCSGLEMSPISEDLRTAGSEDSSNGVNQITQTGSSPLSRSDDLSNQGGETSSDAADSAEKEHLRILLADQAGGSGRTVIVQDNMQPVISVDGTKVIAGKQLVVGSSATVPLTLSLPGTGCVKQVLFPVSTDGRPYVVTKVPKTYRFHQVTMPGGSPVIASTGSGTVLFRQMCVNKSNSNLKQMKLPVVSQMSNHVASQPAVVLPSGSQPFTLSGGPSIDSESLGITLDSTILLNSSSTSTPSIGFIQRNLSKSSQSSSILPQTHQVISQETSTSSGGNDVTIKSENMEIKSETLSEDASRNSDSCEEFKSDSCEEVKFSVESKSIIEDGSNKGSSLYTSPSGNNNWVESLKDANTRNDILNKIEESERNDSVKLKGCVSFEKGLEKRKDGNEASCHEPAENQKLIGSAAYCIEGMNEARTIINSQLNDHWQYDMKLEKACNDIKSEPLSPCLQEAGRDNDNINNAQQNSLTPAQGLKRKVENTIFQIAFKRDKMKLNKDDIIQQRSASIIERELRLQKSLSEECEDLGVDKPSTSDLFPEAELLLDPDPLSRDSLQGEIFSRAESSSSSIGSPNNSPSFTSKCTNSWRKQKRGLLRHKFTYGRNSSPKKTVSEKPESSREKSTPITLNSLLSKSVTFGSKSCNSKFTHISKSTNSNNECGANDIMIECNDSDACNFSDADENNDADILSTEVDSDNDFIQKTQDKHLSHSPNSKELGNDKSIETSPLRVLGDNTIAMCDHFLNNESVDKKSVDNSHWYQIIKGAKMSQDKTNNVNMTRKDMSEPHNGILEEYEDHQGTMNDFASNKTLQARKRKKVGLFLTSPSEDSGSSVDTILGEPDSGRCVHDIHNKKSSFQRRLKKDCVCLNGSSEPTKKKKDLPINEKTEKPCSTKSSFSFSNKKTLTKNTLKCVNRKR